VGGSCALCIRSSRKEPNTGGLKKRREGKCFQMLKQGCRNLGSLEGRELDRVTGRPVAAGKNVILIRFLVGGWHAIRWDNVGKIVTGS